MTQRMNARCINYCFIAALLMVHSTCFAAGPPIVTNRVSFSPRVGFNVSVQVRNLGSSMPSAVGSRMTPDGDPYNYEDGYILTDSSGNMGGQTWYWGYDDSASQVSGNSILLSRSTVTEGASTPVEDAGPIPGVEVLYRRHLTVRGDIRIGVEAAANFQRISFSSRANTTVTVNRVTDAFPFTPGPTPPPTATPSMPYQGTFMGPGFLIGDTASSSTAADISGVPLSSRNAVDANLIGFRLGPYLELPVGNRLLASLSFGLAAAYADTSLSWADQLGSVSASGNGSDGQFLWGFYVNGELEWHISDRWSVFGAVQVQNIGRYEHSFSGRVVDLNLQESVFGTIGAALDF